MKLETMKSSFEQRYGADGDFIFRCINNDPKDKERFERLWKGADDWQAFLLNVKLFAPSNAASSQAWGLIARREEWGMWVMRELCYLPPEYVKAAKWDSTAKRWV